MIDRFPPLVRSILPDPPPLLSGLFEKLAFLGCFRSLAGRPFGLCPPGVMRPLRECSGGRGGGFGVPGGGFGIGPGIGPSGIGPGIEPGFGPGILPPMIRAPATPAPIAANKRRISPGISILNSQSFFPSGFIFSRTSGGRSTTVVINVPSFITSVFEA